MRVAFMCLLLLLFFSGAMSLFELERVSKDTEDILLASKQNVELAGDMLTALNEQNDMMITLAVSSGKFDDIKRYSDRCEASMVQLTTTTHTAQRKMQDTETPMAADSLVMYANRVNELTRSYISGDVHRSIAISLLDSISYQYIRRIANGFDPKKLRLFDVKWVQDFRGNDFLLFNSEWHIRHTLENNEGLELVEFGS